MLNLAGIVEDSIVDGPGIRVTIFAQGCPITVMGATTLKLGPLKGAQLWMSNRFFPLCKKIHWQRE